MKIFIEIMGIFECIYEMGNIVIFVIYEFDIVEYCYCMVCFWDGEVEVDQCNENIVKVSDFIYCYN